MKCYFQPGKTPSETHDTCYKEPLEWKLYQSLKCTGGFQDSKADKLPWKMYTVDGHQSRTDENVKRNQELIHQHRCLTVHDLCTKMNQIFLVEAT
jgi:hypothetical protein